MTSLTPRFKDGQVENSFQFLRFKILNLHKKIFILVTLVFMYGLILAQPAPGDLFKEYKWYNESGDCNGALRVGGNLDYRIQKAVDNHVGEGLIIPPFHIDLTEAIRAELVIEKMLCHGGTEGLRVIINDYKPVYIPKQQTSRNHSLPMPIILTRLFRWIFPT